MMDRRHLKVLFLAACAALASCSDDDDNNNNTPDAALPVDAPGGQTLNSCADADFVANGTTVNFGGNSLGSNYSPKCLRVAVGSTVTFAGNFTTHPLAPGSGASQPTTGTQPNPITSVSTGTSTTVTFSTAGKYPYYCTAHVAGGMWGVVQVQ